MLSLVMDVLGWLGGSMIAGGYMLLSIRRLAPDSATFQALNMVGAVLLGAACVQQGSLPSACLNAIWLAVGVRSVVTGHRQRRRGCAAAARADFYSAA